MITDEKILIHNLSLLRLLCYIVLYFCVFVCLRNLFVFVYEICRHLSIQEVDDLNLEVQRFHRIADMCVLESMQQFQIVHSQYKLEFENNLKRPLLSINKYSMHQDRLLEAVQVLYSNNMK